MKGSLVWRALKPTVTFTSTPKAAAPSSCQSRGGFPQLLAVENSIAAWPPGYSQPLQDLSWYQDLSPTFHSHSSCKRALASSTPAFFCFCFCPCPCGASCRILLQDSKALRWANTKPGLFSSGLFSSPALQWTVEAPRTDHFSPYILGNAQSETCIGSTLMVYRALAHFPRTLATHTPLCKELSAQNTCPACVSLVSSPFAPASLAWIS